MNNIWSYTYKSELELNQIIISIFPPLKWTFEVG